MTGDDMTYELSQRSQDRMDGVHPDIVAVINLAIQRTPIDFTVLEGLRTLDRQKNLVSKGASKTMNSRHLTGHAIDIAPLLNGEVSWDWPLYHQLAPVIKAAADELGVDLEWGGDWRTFKDGPHWQLAWNAYEKDDMEPRAGVATLPPTPRPVAAPTPAIVTRPTIAATPPATDALTRVLGKYAPQGSNTSRMGYALMASGVLIYMAQGAVPALGPGVSFLVDVGLVSPDANGVASFVAGFLAVTGRASMPVRAR